MGYCYLYDEAYQQDQTVYFAREQRLPKGLRSRGVCGAARWSCLRHWERWLKLVVTRWLAGCEDAIESAEWNYGGEIEAVHLIREAGNKMEGEGADWYMDRRDNLKALKSWAEFAAEVKTRFVNEKTGLAAEHTFFNAHQGGTFGDFVAVLTQERSQAGSDPTGTPCISDDLFKRQLLHRCDELLYLRATASPSFSLAKFTVNGLSAYLQSMWDAITLERVTTGVRRMGWRQEASEATQTVGTRPPLLDPVAKEKATREGRCFLCNVQGHISAHCPSKQTSSAPSAPLQTASPRPVVKPALVAAIRQYQETGDSTSFVGLSSDSEEDDKRMFAAFPREGD
ncbi:BQ2448_245 [Microbotryum intermedium]|uniref:BQ2448_245 protein n=1 Tax=Microbotryum intermedium TaxID=269621 RepID=A0A238F8C9_9BASI|nr:BQ2448_245 [Microbotryum intermedium]